MSERDGAPEMLFAAGGAAAMRPLFRNNEMRRRRVASGPARVLGFGDSDRPDGAAVVLCDNAFGSRYVLDGSDEIRLFVAAARRGVPACGGRREQMR